MEKETARKAIWGCLLVVVAGIIMFLAGYGLYSLVTL